MNYRVVFLGLSAILLFSCASSPRYTYERDYRRKTGEGIADLIKGVKHTAIMTASFYGKDFHGRKTSSGEIFDMYGLTAAHKTLPLGTIIKVTYLKTGKSVIVKINDRGPFIPGRDLDLSYGAAAKIGLDKDGVGKVKVTVIKWGDE
ncbi:MAG: septal ring lytic transglycosylase RlpA family protein [Candidatus Marinimicrobia bacterium]|nr:septal ring lytic transglycosylase RlpA family protein [Candidatus Neomarinimicrobiota bacterium]